MRVRKKRHDDAHFPFGGRGNKAFRSKGAGFAGDGILVPIEADPPCTVCGLGPASHRPEGPISHKYEPNEVS